ncbi:F0F1 ATP synthase subunit B [Rhizobium sp. BK376]|uniref:F0F1 ATP synthase subunit B n=1 Tax=Rhizobium sp. BK376 TaxID=2512149 RepID=UPI00104761C4|nr:F0F1 ATP synthase subunit B [Rhizobium sp. BK376]TCR91301.1 F-type H+-transporting ATPase subunit b [Rhizobium sp. BK376]
MFVTPAYAEEAAPAAGETQTETGTPGAHPTFPPFDAKWYPSMLLWLVITFVIFYIVMQKAVIPRVGGILESRHARIAQDVEEASRLKAEADAAVETYESELAAARVKANAIGTAARDAAKVKAEEDRRAIEASLSEELKAAEARIAEVKTKAFADVGSIAEETASSVVEHLIGAAGAQGDVAAAVADASAKREG